MEKKKIYALGFFDGVHLGHQALLTACRHLAERMDAEPAVVTFTAHPDGLISGKEPELINTATDRRRLLCGFGIPHVIELPFDETQRTKPWQRFLEELVDRGAAGFVCGEDFRFGFRGTGNAQLLAEFCRERELAWAVVNDRELDGIRISSTHIRELLKAGEMEQAVRFLGHPHQIFGQVVTGRKLGRTIGVPTANITIDAGVVVPRHGVYACKVIADGAEYLAVTNVGSRPTVGGHRVTVEPWILDFEGDLYGKGILVLFYSFLRPEEKFSSLEALQDQIFRDAQQARQYFSGK